MSGSVVLCCRDLSFSYGERQKPVLNGVSLEVEQSEAVVLMGPSGCGKSTLAYCLAGLYPEYAGALEGQILCGGQSITALSPSLRAQQVSILFQNPDDQFCMDRVDREILFALENINYQGDMPARMQELLSLVGLEELETAMLTSLSGGTKQKVALATALATNPKVLILDEPFANVDPEACREIAGCLEGLAAQTGLTLLIVDHKLDDWRSLATRIVVMNRQGRIERNDILPDQLGRYRGLFRDLGLFFSGDWPYSSPPSPPLQLKPVIAAQGLSAGYGKSIVIPSLDLTVNQGTVTAIMGRNGSGKTTLLWTLAGLIKHGGSLEVDGKVGVVFQNPGYQFLTQRVLDEVVYTLQAISAQQGSLETQAMALLEEFGLECYANHSPYALSQGQQRRLAVLSMLAGEQDILLLDEPTYAQDERATRFIMDLLMERVEQGLTAVFTTHDPQLAQAYAHRIIHMGQGQIRSVEEPRPVGGEQKWIS